MSAEAVQREVLRVGLVSISDRASGGVYQDQGIPALEEWLGTGADTGIAFHHRQGVEVELANLFQRGIVQHGAVDVLDMRRQVANLASLIQDAGLFLPNRAVTQ